MEYFAKSVPNGGSKEEQVTLKQHLDDTVECAQDFFEKFGHYFTEKEKAIIIEACRVHDLGKANIVFQSKINKELHVIKTQEIPHGFLSAMTTSPEEFKNHIPEADNDDYKAFYTAVYHHHVREDKNGDDIILNFCKKYYNPYIRDFLNDESIKAKVSSINKYLLFRNTGSISGNKYIMSCYDKNEYLYEWQEFVLIKGLLNKFDYTVSAGYTEAEDCSDFTTKYLKTSIENIFQQHGLRPVQEYMRDKCDKNLVVVAPTVMGKTEASLLWLNGEKGFYTLPYVVSSNAIYERIRDRYEYKDVAILHSDSMHYYFEDQVNETDSDGYEKYQKAKLLSQPLTICTVDQLFKFVYKALGTEIFAATLKYSKIIIDEIQAYSPSVIAAIIYGLKIVTDMGGKFAIITATFPPVLGSFMHKYGLMADSQYEYRDFSALSDFKRHWIDIKDGDIEIDRVVEDSYDKKVLVICNTVKKAQQIYKSLTEKTDNVHLLHARFTKEHKRMLENEIIKFSDSENETGIWVTTQLVEASLDIDFDVLYTEMSTADSLLQRMGRCNRKGRHIPDKANIHIYINANGVGVSRAIYNREIYTRSVECLEKYIGRVMTESDKSEYINKVYCTDEIKDTDYYRDIEKFLAMFIELTPAEYSKSEADEKFRDINSIKIIPDDVYEDNREVISECIDIMHSSDADRREKNDARTKLDSYVISIQLYAYKKYPDGIDRDVIYGSDIHRSCIMYDFNVVDLTGAGLVLGKYERDIFV